MGMDEIDLQIDCLRTKVDALTVQRPKWASGNSLETRMVISREWNPVETPVETSLMQFMFFKKSKILHFDQNYIKKY